MMQKFHRKLLRGITAVFLSVLLAIGAAMPAFGAAGQAYDFPDNAAPVNLELDGKPILKDQAAILDSVTYVPLRAFCELAGASDIDWDAKTKTATVTRSRTVISVTDGSHMISAAGRYFYTDAVVRNIGNRLFVPIRPLASALGMSVEWNAGSRTVILHSVLRNIAGASEFYNANDLYWLSRIIQAEAGGESLRGQIAVGNVVLNRKADPSFPNTVYGVIFDRTGGIQFSPVANGAIYKTPSASAIMAAKICLEGYSVSTRALFFMNPRIATSSWISRNRPYLFTIGNHCFYA